MREKLDAVGSGTEYPHVDSGEDWSSSPVGRLASGSAWSLASTVLSQAFGLIGQVVLARFLGTAGFGEYAAILSTTATFGIFAGLGLGLTATKYLSQYKNSDPAKAGQILGLTLVSAWISSGVVSVILCVLAEPIAKYLFMTPKLALPIGFASLMLLLSVVNGVQLGALTGLESFRSITLINLGRGIIQLPLLAVGGYYWGVLGAVIGNILAIGLGVGASQVALTHQCHRNGIVATYRGSFKESPILWTFSLPALVSRTLVAPVTWVANALIVRGPGGMVDLGFVGAANQWKIVLLTIPLALMNAGVPVLSSEEAKLGHTRSGDVLTHIQAITSLIVIPVCFLLLAWSDRIVLVYGAEFADAEYVFFGVVIGSAFCALATSSASVITAQGRMWLATALNGIWAVTLISIMFLNYQTNGAQTYSIAFVISYLGHLFWSLAVTRRFLPRSVTSLVYHGFLLIVALALVAILMPAPMRHIISFPLFLLLLVGGWRFFLPTSAQHSLLTLFYQTVKTLISIMRTCRLNLPFL